MKPDGTPEILPNEEQGLEPYIEEKLPAPLSDIHALPLVDESNQPDHLLELAASLFFHTHALHGLGMESQEILEQAIRMRAAPLARSKKKKPYRVALDLIQSRTDQDLSESGQRLLAAILVFQQGKLKRKDLARLGLPPTQQREALTLSAIIRIAEGLDHSGSGKTCIQSVEPSDSGILIIVEGPAASLDAPVGQQQARLWKRIGYPDVEILEPEEAAIRILPFPEPTDTIGILPADSLVEAGRKVMRFQFAQMLRHEAGTRLGEDIEALHDMRVATRRLRAAFEVFDQAFDTAALKPHLKGLRMTGRTLGAVRDLDVFMEKAQAYIETLPLERRPGLDPLLTRWKEQRETARAHMLEFLDSPEYARFKRRFNIFLNTPGAGACPIPTDEPAPFQVCHLAPALVYERLASVRAYDPWLKNAPIERLHMLRIEFKKLRYTLEYFREVLGKRAFDVIADVKLLQDHLGDLNDAQVATQILTEFIASLELSQHDLPIAERENIEEVVNYLAARHAERHHLLVTFPTVWAAHFQYRTFRRNLASAIAAL